MTYKVALILIIVGGFILILGMTLALKSMKPMYVNVIAGLIILIGSFFGLFGKQLQDQSSSEKTDKILTNITGGDSYCVFEVYFKPRSKQPIFMLRHVGSTPLKNVQVTIEDLARRLFLIEKIAKNDYSSPLVSEISDSTYYNIEYPSIYPSTILEIPIPVEIGQNDIRMRIWINLNNGRLFETIEVNNFREKNRTYKLELKRGDKVLEFKNH